jgi:hypothetical protein
MPHNWDNEAVNQYLSLRPSQLSEDEFCRIHHTIDKIRIEYLHTPTADGEIVTQEEFRDAIISADLLESNRIIIVEGEVGSGKSHLCTWLRHELGDTPAKGQNDRVAVQLTSGTRSFINQLDKLSNLVDADSQLITIDEFEPEALAEAIVGKLRVYRSGMIDSFSEQEITALTESRKDEFDLTGIIEDNIRTYQSDWSSEESPVLELIDRDEYRQLRMVAFGEPPNEQGFELLRTELNNALADYIGISDLSNRLTPIADAAIAEGFRPVLICADISVLWPFRDALLEYGDQLQSGHFDIVIGWPTGWIREKQGNDQDDFYTHIQEKSEGYFQISNHQGEPYFLTKYTAVSLVERYVQAIKSASNEAFTDTVRPESFGGLYPFNASFVSRLYTHLQQEGVQRRTTRLLLRAIRECLLASDPPFETVEHLTYVESTQEPITLDNSSAADIIKWYGMRGEHGIAIPQEIFETFDVVVPAEIRQNPDIKLTE